MAGYYEAERAYLKAVRAGDLGAARAVLRSHPKLLDEEATLVAPIYFRRPEITDEVAVRLTRALTRDRIVSFSLRRLIQWIGDARLTQLEPEILRLVKHPHSEIRWAALHVLSFSWDLRRHRTLYERFLLKDTDDGIRGSAATGLGYVLRGTRDRRATRLLSRVLRDKTEALSVRHEAYDALYDLWFYHHPRSPRSHRHFLDLLFKSRDDPAGWQSGVDWGLVAGIEHGTLPRGHPLVPNSRRLSARGRGTHGATLKVEGYYKPIRRFLLGVLNGDPAAVQRVLNARPTILNSDEALFAPIFFRKPEIARYVADRVSTAIERRRISTTGLYGLIHWFGETEMFDLESDIVRYLGHPKESMREIALSVLTLHWKSRKYRDRYEALLEKDPSSEVRREAASGLGWVLAQTRDTRASKLLARRVKDKSEDYDVKQTAYEALRDLWLSRRRRSREERVYWRDLREAHERDPKAWEAWVDWEFVSALERGKVPRGFTATADRTRRAGRRQTS